MLGGNPSFTFSCFLLFLSLEVVASVATSLYLFFLFSVPSLASNALKVRSVVSQSRNGILSFNVRKSKNSQNFIFFSEIFRQRDWYFYLSFFSFDFSDLSYRSASKNSIFTECSDSDRFCFYFVFISLLSSNNVILLRRSAT